MQFENNINTDRTRSMAEGTVFTGMCHSFCPQGLCVWEGVVCPGVSLFFHWEGGGEYTSIFYRAGVLPFFEKMGERPPPSNTAIRSMRGQ